jgi:integrase/recombinase XerD
VSSSMSGAKAHTLWALTHEDMVRRRLAPKTISNTRHVLFNFWASIAPRRPLSATPKDLERWLDRPAALSSPAKRDLLGDNTRASQARVVCGWYRWAEREGLCRGNRMARFVPPKMPEATPRALERDQVTQLFRDLELAGTDRDHLLVWLAFGCGRRAGEIARLRLEHVRLGERPTMRVHGKGGKVRSVPIAPVVADALRRHLAGRARTGWVIANEQHPSRGITPGTVTRLLSRLIHAAGIQETGHALRHTFATELMRGGANLRAVANLLLHSSTAVTEAVYTQSWDGDAEAALALLADPRTEPVGVGS